MRKMALLGLLLLTVFLAACGASRPKDERLMQDFGSSVTVNGREMAVRKLTVEEQTEDEDTRILAVTVEAGDAEVTYRGGYTMSYRQDKDGWLCTGVRTDFGREYKIIPLTGADRKTALDRAGEGSTIVESSEDLENGVCTFRYSKTKKAAYCTLTTTGTLRYIYSAKRFAWGFDEETDVSTQGEWDIAGKWVSVSQEGYLTSGWSRPITVEITEVRADSVHLIATYQGKGGVIFEGDVPLDPAAGVDVKISHPDGGWDDFGFIITPDGAQVTGTGLRKAEKMVRASEVQMPDAVTPADTEFTYDLDRAAGTATIRSYKGKESYLRLPDAIEGCAVTVIGDGAFENNRALVQIILPETVREIGNEAFRGCSSLSDLTLPQAVKSIGRRAFENCSKLYLLTLPEGMETLAPYAFAETAFDYFVLPDSITEIPEGLFKNANLRGLRFSDRLTAIGSSAFSGCSYLAEFTAPDTVTAIGNAAFERCTGLKSVTVGKAVRSIGDKAFYVCDKLTELTLPDSVAVIGQEAFCGCKKLASLKMPAAMESIGWKAFYGCSALTEMTVPQGITLLEEYTFYGCDSLNVLRLPRSLRTVKEHAFSSCERLTTVYYAGSESDWAGVSVGQYGNNALREANMKWNG